MFHATVDTLLRGGTIETERIEFKRGWNSEKVLHTICAFANDIGDVGGGYVVIGVEEEEGRPGEVVGVRKSEVPEMEKDLIRCCNMIEPRYVPPNSTRSSMVERLWLSSGPSAISAVPSSVPYP